MKNFLVYLFVFFLPAIAHPFSVPEYRPVGCPNKIGDLSGNGYISSYDTALAMQVWEQMKNRIEPSACQLYLMNTDDDSEITERDLKIIGFASVAYAGALPVVTGDSNSDYRRTGEDVDFYVGVLEGYIRANPFQLFMGDLDGDSRLTGSDVALLSQRIADGDLGGEFCGTETGELQFSFSDETEGLTACGCPVPPPVPPAFAFRPYERNKKANNVIICNARSATPAAIKIAAPARLEGIDDGYLIKNEELPLQTDGAEVLKKFLKGIVDSGKGKMGVAAALPPVRKPTILNRKIIIREGCPNTSGCRQYSVHAFLAGPVDEPDIHLFKKEKPGQIITSYLGAKNNELITKFLRSSGDEALDNRRIQAFNLYFNSQIPHARIHERDQKGADHARERILNDPKYESSVEICGAGDFESDTKLIEK